MTRNQASFSSIVLPLLLASAVTACGEPESPSATGSASSVNSSGGTTGVMGSGTNTGGTTSAGSGGTGTGTTATNTGTTSTTAGTTTGSAGTGTTSPTTGGTTTSDVGGGTMAGGDVGGGTMAGGDIGGGTMAGGDIGGGTMAGGDMGGGDMAGGTMAGGTMAGGTMAGGDMGGAGGACTFTIIEDGVSTAIGSVGIVKWSASEAVNDAVIEFDLADGSGVTLTAPVDLAEPDYRTLLLGMKAGREYVYRIAINGGACVSDDYPIETDPAPNSVPIVNVTNGDASDFGFIVTSAGLGNAGGGFGGGFGGGGGGGSSMYIFDTDGDIVWWTDAPGSCSRARMDYEGKNMWMTSLNYPRGSGEMRYVSMDGLEGQNNVQGLGDNHHDFTVAPGGIVTAILWAGTTGGGIPDNSIVERSPDGTMNTVVQSVDSSLYACTQAECHGNSITYHAATDTYVLSDRYPNLYVNFDRSGTLLWQAGGMNPKGTHYAGSWSVNHGHQLLDNGNLLIFNNGQGQSSPVIEFELSGSTATEVWRYASDGSNVLGDVQRLENGNTVVTYSNTGRILEVNNDSIVREYSTDSLGYSMFRTSLYGPPPK